MCGPRQLFFFHTGNAKSLDTPVDRVCYQDELMEVLSGGHQGTDRSLDSLNRSWELSTPSAWLLARLSSDVKPGWESFICSLSLLVTGAGGGS